MAVQPLNKTKIIKKITNKIRRYQSDEFASVKVSLALPLAEFPLKSWLLTLSSWHGIDRLFGIKKIIC